MNNHTFVSRWIAGTLITEEYAGKNIWADGDVLYTYSKPLAVVDRKAKVIYVNSKPYSPTSSGHRNLVYAGAWVLENGRYVHVKTAPDFVRKSAGERTIKRMVEEQAYRRAFRHEPRPKHVARQSYEAIANDVSGVFRRGNVFAEAVKSGAYYARSSMQRKAEARKRRAFIRENGFFPVDEWVGDVGEKQATADFRAGIDNRAEDLAKRLELDGYSESTYIDRYKARYSAEIQWRNWRRDAEQRAA